MLGLHLSFFPRNTLAIVGKHAIINAIVKIWIPLITGTIEGAN